MTHTPARKGATRLRDISPSLLQTLNAGQVPSATLVEALAIDHAVLARHALPDLSPHSLTAALKAQELGILQRMKQMANVLLAQYGQGITAYLQTHVSDTVRGWACFIIAELPALSLRERLDKIAPLANDEHFGVREWSWLALRPYVVAAPSLAVEQLRDWSLSPSERLRRFSCEILRPRGVWCPHIADFKINPAAALPILEALRNDSSIYVQDSVANWLNDAAKSQPEWVRALCQSWAQETVPEHARAALRVLQRAQRKLVH
ncbi:DNA alkylation repair protein [Alcaligenes sp. WGS1538]|uniref:DNA alkylation repair protein n=1 Tax=Alcaligenes sp. WGS1538 TaxID=3366811 RepID=UPI00372D60A7